MAFLSPNIGFVRIEIMINPGVLLIFIRLYTVLRSCCFLRLRLMCTRDGRHLSPTYIMGRENSIRDDLFYHHHHQLLGLNILTLVCCCLVLPRTLKLVTVSASLDVPFSAKTISSPFTCMLEIVVWECLIRSFRGDTPTDLFDAVIPSFPVFRL